MVRTWLKWLNRPGKVVTDSSKVGNALQARHAGGPLQAGTANPLSAAPPPHVPNP